MQRFLPGLFDRLIEPDATADSSDRRGTYEDLKESVMRDLEALLNTRAAIIETALAPYPEVSASVVNYGLIDFAGMCMTSDTDQKTICAAVKLAIVRHEPRLEAIDVGLRVHKGAVNRVDFVIKARFKGFPSAEPVHFDAELQPSSQRYSFRNKRSARAGAI